MPRGKYVRGPEQREKMRQIQRERNKQHRIESMRRGGRKGSAARIAKYALDKTLSDSSESTEAKPTDGAQGGKSSAI